MKICKKDDDYESTYEQLLIKAGRSSMSIIFMCRNLEDFKWTESKFYKSKWNTQACIDKSKFPSELKHIDIVPIQKKR